MSTHSLNDADNSVAWTFNIPKTGSVTKVGVYCAAETGSSPAYNAGLVTVDATGTPTVDPYGGSANGTITFTGEGMVWLTLPTPATAIAGEWAAVRVWPTASAPDGSNYASIQYHSPFDGSGISGYFTTGWVLAAFSGPSMAVEYSDGTVFGFAPGGRTCTTSYNSGSTPNEYGNKFVTPVAMTVTGARFHHLKAGLGSGFTGDVVLYDNADNVISSLTISDRDYVDSTDLIDVHWPAVTLAANTTYRITIKPAVALSAGNIYIGRLIFDSATAKDAMPGAVGHVATYRTDGGAWTDTTAEVAAIGLIVTAVDIPSGGTVVGGEYAYIG